MVIDKLKILIDFWGGLTTMIELAGLGIPDLF
jgi:hypothetical protein